MQGKIEFICDGKGIEGHVHISDVSMLDKWHLLYTLENALEISDLEFQLYTSIGRKMANESVEQTTVDMSKLDELLFGGSDND